MRAPLGKRSALTFLACLTSACAGTSPSVAPTPAPSMSASSLAPAAAQVDFQVDGRKMHIYCEGPTGTGRPTVIFENGLEGLSETWNTVFHALAGSVRACAYDRAGTGRQRQSDPAAVGRTTSDQVADLHALLAAAEIPPPYVLVGFSAGGWNVMVYADTYPADVVGAIMADVRPPAASRRWLAALPAESPSEPAPVKDLRYEVSTFDTDPKLNEEGLLLRDSATEAIETSGFRDTPLRVLAVADISSNFAGFDPDLAATLEGIWWELQAELASRSSAGRLVKVDCPVHDIPSECPDPLVEAIRELVGN
jgi:pimeloyl-ACP methyl ester carboxylesterase